MAEKKKSVWIGVGVELGIGLLLVAAWVAFLALFVARSYEFVASEDGRMSFGVCEFRKDAFCIGPEWEGGDLSFEIPDEFMGFPVTKLGGYTGRGYPCPFAARVNTQEVDFVCDDGFFDLHHSDGDDCETLIFSLHMGKNVRSFDGVDGKMYCGKDLENGEYDFLYKIAYSFTVDGENETFYAENGRLYKKASGELVEDFFYE